MRSRMVPMLAGAALLTQAGPAWSYDISDRFSISTLVEVEAFDSNDAEGDFSGSDHSDVELSTVEVALDARPTDRLTGHLLFLFEEPEGDEVVVDEATVSLALSDMLGITAGREYVPFGRFDSFMVSDPQTLELGETRETALQLDFVSGALSGAVYGYSGDTRDAADGDSIGSFGASVDYGMESGATLWAVGASVTSNLGESDALQYLDAGGTPGALRDEVAGLGLHAAASVGRVAVIAEHLRALDEFAAGDLGGAVAGPREPSASNLEVGLELDGGWTLAAAYQRTDEAHFAGLPESVLAATVGYQVSEHVGLALEVNHKEDYDIADGGSGDDSRTILGQLAVEF